jgi:hypothetical protein
LNPLELEVITPTSDRLDPWTIEMMARDNDPVQPSKGKGKEQRPSLRFSTGEYAATGMTFDDFKAEYDTDPENLWQHMTSNFDDLHNKWTERGDRLDQKETQINDLIQERDFFQDQVNVLNAQLVDSLLQNRGTTPGTVSGAGGSKKSTKHPDPDKLNSKKEGPKFENWKILITDKLKANADHYPAEDDKKIYVYGRTTGDAQKHLTPRYQKDVDAGGFATALEMISYLATIFEDPNKKQNAWDRFRVLFMKKDQEFTDFYTTFLHEAGEAEISETTLPAELRARISIDLKKALVHIDGVEDLGLQELATKLTQRDQQLKKIKALEERFAPRQKSQNPARPAAGTVPEANARTPQGTSSSFKSSFRPRL